MVWLTRDGVITSRSAARPKCSSSATIRTVRISRRSTLDDGRLIDLELSFGGFTGERDGQIVDLFGHRWGLTQRVRDVPRDEVAREAARVFGGHAG